MRRRASAGRPSGRRIPPERGAWERDAPGGGKGPSMHSIQKLQFFTEKEQLYLPGASRKYTRATCSLYTMQKLQFFTEKKQLYLPGVSRKYTHSTCSLCAVQKLQFFPLAEKPSALMQKPSRKDPPHAEKPTFLHPVSPSSEIP